MISQEQRMIDKQAELISRLNSEIGTLKCRVNALQKEVNDAKEHAKIYLQIQELIREYPAMQADWDQFLTTMRMCAPDAFR